MSTGFKAIQDYTSTLATIYNRQSSKGTDFQKAYDNLKEIEISPIPSHPPYLAFLQNHPPIIKECYDNARMFCSEFTEAKYVIGYATSHIPIEHAWIRLGDLYVDTTAEMLGLEFSSYAVLKEYSWEEFTEVMCELERAPMIGDFLSSIEEQRKDN